MDIVIVKEFYRKYCLEINDDKKFKSVIICVNFYFKIKFLKVILFIFWKFYFFLKLVMIYLNNKEEGLGKVM